MSTVSSQTTGYWQTANPRAVEDAVPWTPLAPTQRDIAIGHQQAETTGLQSIAPWGDSVPRDVSSVPEYQIANPSDPQDSLTTWNKLRDVDVRSSLPWDKVRLEIGIGYHLIYISDPAWRDSQVSTGFYRSDERRYLKDPDALITASLYYPNNALSFTFDGKYYSPAPANAVFFDFRYLTEAAGIIPTDSYTGSSFQSARELDKIRTQPWGWGNPSTNDETRVIYPDYSGPVVVVDPPPEPELLEAYMIGNLVTVTEPVSGTPLLCSDLSLSYDASSFSWALTMSVMGKASLDLIRPGSGGAAGVKQVVIDINGHVWVMIIEKYTRDFSFASEAYSVTGSSRTMLLSDPYALKSSGYNPLDINASQIMTDALSGTGFTLNWDLVSGTHVPDWTIPAGAFTFSEQAPVQLIARLATAIGAIAMPGMSDDSINIIPLYQFPVWEWETTLVSKILPAEIITGLGGDWVPKPAYNSCYVSGNNYGVGVLVTRSGTAGDIPAPDVYEDAMTDPTANQYRGKVELCKGGDQEMVTLQLPLFPVTDLTNPGLVLPGTLCEVREVGLTWVGLCLGTQIDCSGTGASAVTQTLKLERHTEEIV